MRAAARVARTGHFGLRWLRERVEALDGTLAIDNTPPRGAALRMTLPIGHGT